MTRTHLVLAVHTPLDIAGLDEVHDVVLDLVDRPPERGAHPLEFDRREGLEVEHDGAVPDGGDEVADVRREVDVDPMSGLCVGIGVTKS